MPRSTPVPGLSNILNTSLDVAQIKLQSQNTLGQTVRISLGLHWRLD